MDKQKFYMAREIEASISELQQVLDFISSDQEYKIAIQVGRKSIPINEPGIYDMVREYLTGRKEELEKEFANI